MRPSNVPACACPWRTRSAPCSAIGSASRSLPRHVDALGLALERLRDRRVVEEHDPDVAVDDVHAARGDRLRLGGRLGVHLAQERLAEVGQHRAGEAADEALAPTMPTLEPPATAAVRAPSSTRMPAAASTLRELPSPAGVAVVVAEHGEDRQSRAGGRLREDLRLARARRGRQVAGEQDEVCLDSISANARSSALARSPGRMDVACRGDAHHAVRCCTFATSETTPAMPTPTFEELIEAMKVGASDPRSAPGSRSSSEAGWRSGRAAARSSEHDVDLSWPEDADAALEALRGRAANRAAAGGLALQGLARNGALIDIIFPPGGPSRSRRSSGRRARGDGDAAAGPRRRGRDDEQAPRPHRAGARLQRVLELARAIREQIDWEALRARTEASPFASAFFTLIEELGIVDVTDRATSTRAATNLPLHEGLEGRGSARRDHARDGCLRRRRPDCTSQHSSHSGDLLVSATTRELEPLISTGACGARPPSPGRWRQVSPLGLTFAVRNVSNHPVKVPLGERGPVAGREGCGRHDLRHRGSAAGRDRTDPFRP